MPSPYDPHPGHHPHSRWNAVVERAREDADFRAALLRDPARALRDTMGVLLPPGFRLKVVECPPELDALLVLPHAHAGAEGELSEAELEEVAGGGDDWTTNPPPPPPP